MKIKDIKEKLMRKRKNTWEVFKKSEIEKFSKAYKRFIEKAKTEREFVELAVEELRNAGFVSFDEFLKDKSKDKVYFVKEEKALFALKIGKELSEGMNIIAAHIDVPRIDLKPEPLYQSSDFAFAKTHYYGGIKKYQWLNIPLAIHGVIIKSNGEKIKVSIGEKENDPVFVISDLLPHLDRREGDVRKVFQAEKMNLILGNIPISFSKEEKDAIKLNVLKILNDMFGIVEEDLISAELELVPALKPRDVGLDRSMIGAYGHDDRICSFAALKAFVENENSKKTTALMLLDKEEIGSDGNTGAKSLFWLTILKRILKEKGVDSPSIIAEDMILNSVLLSADVAAAFDPNYPDVYDEYNTPKMGYGVVLVKYTGIRGKAGTNDAHAELIGKLRNILNEFKIPWQTGELGKVDQGGGGTVAKFFAQYGMNVIDIGVGLLGMHSPYEIASKGDLYSMYKAFKVLYENM